MRGDTARDGLLALLALARSGAKAEPWRVQKKSPKGAAPKKAPKPRVLPPAHPTMAGQVGQSRPQEGRQRQGEAICGARAKGVAR